MRYLHLPSSKSNAYTSSLFGLHTGNFAILVSHLTVLRSLKSLSLVSLAYLVLGAGFHVP